MALFIAIAIATHSAVPQDTSTDVVEHGRYLVHDVAMCIECHTPRDDSGNLEATRLLQGAPVPVESPYPAQQWACQAPQLAGLPAGFREQDLVELLRTGKGPRGRSPSPPMPPFRMSQKDAEAVAAYLKSVERK
jgi:mono/diheme cytochrome c family protein